MALLLASRTSQVARATEVTNAFTTIPGNTFINVLGNEQLSTVSYDNITFTGSQQFTIYVWSEGSPPVPYPDDPGDGTGIGFISPYTLNFSSPLASIGATFNGLLGRLPAVIQAYSGPNGTGTLIGTVENLIPPYPVTGASQLNYAGIWSSSVNIESAVFSSSEYGAEYYIDGYSASLTPAPEPGSIVLIALGAVSLIFVGRRRRSACRVHDGKQKT